MGRESGPAPPSYSAARTGPAPGDRPRPRRQTRSISQVAGSAPRLLGSASWEQGSAPRFGLAWARGPVRPQRDANAANLCSAEG